MHPVINQTNFKLGCSHRVCFLKHKWKQGKSGEISFYPLQTKKTTVFAENLMKKCQISKSREGQAPCPPLPNPTPTGVTKLWISCSQTRN